MNVLVAFDPPAPPVTSNDRNGSAFRRRDIVSRKNLWLEAAYFATCAAFPGVGPDGRVMPPCDVFVSIPVFGERSRDPGNWYPTVKAIVDGIRMAGVWPDDNQMWVTTHEADLRVVRTRAEMVSAQVLVRLAPRS